MKLLAIGGPRHGEELPYTEGRNELLVPVIPALRTVQWETRSSCVHAVMDSRHDGNRPSSLNTTITVATYRTKVVADRLCWVLL